MLFREQYSNNKKLVKYSKKIIRNIRTKEHTKPSGSTTPLYRKYKNYDEVTIHKTIRTKIINKRELLNKNVKMKREIIEEISKRTYFPKSLKKLNTLNDEEWHMFIPVIRMWLNDRTTLPDQNTTFEEIKNLVFDAHKKAKLKLSKINNFDNFDNFINNLSSEYSKTIKI